MLIAEAQTFVREQIITRWPRWKRSGVEVSDFVRQLKKIDTDTALEAIIRCKETSKTITYPVLAEFRTKIAEVIREEKKDTPHTNRAIDEYMECYALDEETGKYRELMIKTESVDEAKVRFAKDIEYYGGVATDYTFYIGESTFSAFSQRRWEVRKGLFPEIEERAKKLQEIVDGGGKIIPVIGKKVEAPPFDPDFDDGIPF